MKKYVIGSKITTIDQLERAATGVIINGTTFPIWDKENITKFKYNDPSLYTKRAIAQFPESTALNTTITNDGLIAIADGTCINIIDLFEDETNVYTDILPVDYQDLLNVTEDTNPLNKRIFIVNSDEFGVITTKNELIDESRYYFNSEMDYDITFDEDYGYYITDSGTWISTYKSTADFQFYKKQIFVIESNLTNLSVTIVGLVEGTDYEVTDLGSNKKAYIIKYLDMATNEEFLVFNFSADINLHGYITIY